MEIKQSNIPAAKNLIKSSWKISVGWNNERALSTASVDKLSNSFSCRRDRALHNTELITAAIDFNFLLCWRFQWYISPVEWWKWPLAFSNNKRPINRGCHSFARRRSWNIRVIYREIAAGKTTSASENNLSFWLLLYCK